MTDYAIGDVQGCYDGLLKLLDLIHFDDKIDRLWFVGDLVNRGPQSLEVLRFIKALPQKAQITLGNHDLHLLRNLYATPKKHHADDTLQAILNAPDKDALGTWLRHQPLLIHDARLNVVMSHAGIAPIWDLAQAKRYALEAQQILIGDNYQQAFYFNNKKDEFLYGWEQYSSNNEISYGFTGGLVTGYRKFIHQDMTIIVFTNGLKEKPIHNKIISKIAGIVDSELN